LEHVANMLGKIYSINGNCSFVSVEKTPAMVVIGSTWLLHYGSL